MKLPETAQLEGSFQRWCWLYAKAYYRASAGLPSGVPGESGAMAQQVAHLLCKQGVRGSSPLGSTYLPLTEASYLLVVAGESREVQQRVQQWWPTECLQWPLLGRWSRSSHSSR